MKKILSIPEAAEELGISKAHAYRLAKDDEFPIPVVKAGARYLVPAAGLYNIIGWPENAEE